MSVSKPTEDTMTAEEQRLEEARLGVANWRRWGPYLSERQWGTVREDYSPDGTAWEYFTHDQARSRAYRWGEDGLAGLSDDHQRLCFAIALWNGHDPILKERAFGLTGTEGNHGEDVKESYFYPAILILASLPPIHCGFPSRNHDRLTKNGQNKNCCTANLYTPNNVGYTDSAGNWRAVLIPRHNLSDGVVIVLA